MGSNVIVTNEDTDTVYVEGPGFLIAIAKGDVRLVTARDLDRAGIKTLTEALDMATRIPINKWLEAVKRRFDA